MIAYRSLFVMGTRMEMVFPSLDDERADYLCHILSEDLLKLEKKYSRYDPDSLVSEINTRGVGKPVNLDLFSFELFEKLEKYHQLCEGYFDFTLGYFKDNEEEFNTDNYEILKGKSVREKITLDKKTRTLKINYPRVELDLGSVGKGLALDRAYYFLKKQKISNAFISFGESSVLTIGRHPAGDHWKVGIEDLVVSGENAWIFEQNDGFVSTSGNSLRNLERNQGGHIFNPHSGKFIRSVFLVSVQGKSALITEILSTSLFCAGAQEGKKILGKFPEYRAVLIDYDEASKETNILKLNEF